MINESFNPDILETMKQDIENQLESIAQPHLNPLEDAIKLELSSLGDASVNVYENDVEGIFGDVTFRKERELPDLNKIKNSLEQVKGFNVQIIPDQVNKYYEREYDGGRVFYPKFKFTAKKG